MLAVRLQKLASRGMLKPVSNFKSLGDYIREQRRQAQISVRQLAQAAGVSNPYLSQIERGLRKPSADILQQIAKGLRISAEALYVQAGILDDRPSDSEVPIAIRADPAITERQKQVLLEIYDSFRKENKAVDTTKEQGDARPNVEDMDSWASAADPVTDRTHNKGEASA